MKAVIVGSTGLVGKSLLEQLNSDAAFTQVIALVRKKTNHGFEKVKEIEVDFENLPSSAFLDAAIVFCCLGTTIKKAGSQEAFRKVDFEYPFNTAKIAKSQGVESFAIVTAMGSDASSSIFYNRVKGEIEKALTDLKFERLGVFRPSMLLGERTETRIGERIGQVVMNLFGFLIPKNYKAIDAQKVASAMVKFAKQQHQKGRKIVLSGEMY
ncbi:MAG TPA: oxidoreductase [Leadbetterella sp.]|nr:oxidoreductase [Leadbetterella sp.]